MTNTVVDHQRYKVNILDTAGQKEFHDSLLGEWVSDRDAFILVYDMSDTKSFEEMKLLWARLRSCRNENGLATRFVVVGNKKDLEDARKVTAKQALSFSNEAGAVSFFETSALTGRACRSPFETLIRHLRRKDARLSKLPSASTLLVKSNSTLSLSSKEEVDKTATASGDLGTVPLSKQASSFGATVADLDALRRKQLQQSALQDGVGAVAPKRDCLCSIL